MSPLPAGIGPARFDWNRHRRPGLATFSRLALWTITGEAALGCPLLPHAGICEPHRETP